MYIIFFVFFYLLSYSHYVVDRLSSMWSDKGVGQSIE